MNITVNRQNIKKDNGLLYSTASFQDFPYKNEMGKISISRIGINGPVSVLKKQPTKKLIIISVAFIQKGMGTLSQQKADDCGSDHAID